MAAVEGFDQAGLDERLYMFVQRAAGTQAERLTEFVMARRVIIMIKIIKQILIDFLLAAGEFHGTTCLFSLGSLFYTRRTNGEHSMSTSAEHMETSPLDPAEALAARLRSQYATRITGELVVAGRDAHYVALP